MRSYDSSDEDDVKTVADEHIQPWMLECIARNPEYVHWGPYEDVMSDTGKGWGGRVVNETWADFGPWNLDELNECANFYFYAERDSETCKKCDGSGYNPATHRIAEDFYDLTGAGRRWCESITQDEVQALVDAGRLMDFTHSWTRENGWQRDPVKPIPTATEVNRAQKVGGIGRSHDAINRFILVEARAKRLGVWGRCETCSGRGSVYTSESARLGLVLWMLHPRKGASRGVDVKNIRQEELPAVLAWLRQAAERNAARFAGALRTP